MGLMKQAGRSFEDVESKGWTQVQAFVPLAVDEVQVWRVRAVGEGTFYEACFALLSADELERWKRLRAGVARDEFVIARGCLRTLLGAALGVEARGIVLPVGKHGKPFVDGFQFNVTHSKGLILLALSKDAEIGIDVEWIDSGIEAMEIARDTFAAAEIAQIAAAEGDARIRAFYRCWVRKEAVAKAHGQGITLSLQDFQVDLAAEGETRVIVTTEPGGSQDFYLQALPVETGYSGALALTRPGCTIRLFDLPPAMIIGQ